MRKVEPWPIAAEARYYPMVTRYMPPGDGARLG